MTIFEINAPGQFIQTLWQILKMNETKIDTIDYVLASIYLGVGMLIWLAYIFSFLPQEQINQMLMAITLGGPVSLFLMYYKRLRIKSVMLLWSVIGIVQMITVYQLKGNPDFRAVNGTYADNHLSLLTMVVMVLIFRVTSLLITRQELVVAAWFSPDDYRKPNILDYIFTLIGFLFLTLWGTLI
ncbi:hypothetical protein [Nibribacter koreensis]